MKNKDYTYYISTFGWTYEDHYRCSGSGNAKTVLRILAEFTCGETAEAAKKAMEAGEKFEYSYEARGGTSRVTVEERKELSL